MITTAETLAALTEAPAAWGWLDLNVSQHEGLSAIERYSHGAHANRVRIGGQTRHLPEPHRLRGSHTIECAAVWYRAKPDVPLSSLHRYASQRPNAVSPVGDFRDFIAQGWREPPVARCFLALTEDRSTDPTTWSAWDLAGGGVTPAQLLVYDKSIELTSIFEGHWPRTETHTTTVAVIGVGSIGSAAAAALPGYEIRNIILVDPDRLQPHNIARHQCGAEDIGRYKVDAVADLIRRDNPATKVTALRYNVIADADRMRPLLDNVDLVICATDGVAARQTTSHLCSTARTPAVFACVLENGALGELVRDPARSDTGCLRCLRRHLEASGGLDPEPGLDLEYGTGTTHRPMTAIAGDLRLMGAMAAKTAVATILERRGHRDQRMTGNHIAIGLRPNMNWEAPFNQSRVLDFTASSVPTPDPECPLCCGDRSYE